jgi:hypothetical protein
VAAQLIAKLSRGARSLERDTAPLLVLAALAKEAALAGDCALYAFAQRALGGKAYCPSAIALYKSTGAVIRKECGRRACDFCADRRRVLEVESVLQRFRALGRPVYVLTAPNRRAATSVVDYASRCGEAALALPDASGRCTVFTTHSRRDAGHPLDDATLGELLDAVFRTVPATEGKERQVRIKGNAALKAAIPVEPPASEQREDVDDGEPWALLRPAAEAYLVENQLGTETDTWGRVAKFERPADPEQARALAEALGEIPPEIAEEAAA